MYLTKAKSVHKRQAYLSSKRMLHKYYGHNGKKKYKVKLSP
jgi:hypothetical protein